MDSRLSSGSAKYAVKFLFLIPDKVYSLNETECFAVQCGSFIDKSPYDLATNTAMLRIESKFDRSRTVCPPAKLPRLGSHPSELGIR